PGTSPQRRSSPSTSALICFCTSLATALPSMIDAMIYSVLRLKNLYRKKKNCKDATFYWHDTEPSKGQPQKLVEQQRKINECDQQIPLTKTLESCNKKTSLYPCCDEILLSQLISFSVKF